MPEEMTNETDKVIDEVWVQGAHAASADQKLFLQGEDDAEEAAAEEVEGRSHLQTSDYDMKMQSTVLTVIRDAKWTNLLWNGQRLADDAMISRNQIPWKIHCFNAKRKHLKKKKTGTPVMPIAST